MKDEAGALNYRDMINANADGVIILDSAGKVRFANPAAARLFGRSMEALLGREFGHPVVTGKTAEMDIVRPDGRPVIAELRAVETRWEGDAARLVSLRDVTERKEMEERSLRQERLAAVGQLAAGIAHDFNNMLTVVIGTAQLMEIRPDFPENFKADAKVIIQQGQRAAGLVRQILDFSRRSVVERHPMNLASFLKEGAKMLRNVLPEHIEIVMAGVAGDFTVCANPTQMEQILMNLSLNARDAMPEGGTLTVTLRRETGPSPDGLEADWVVWEVADTGSGMPPEVLSRIFEPFFTTKAPGQGTGLGLPQVYGIVKQHMGDIDVESAEGKGTKVRIFLPHWVGDTVVAQEKDALAVSGAGKSVLVVEDDRGVLQVVRRFLEKLGFRVLTARNGVEALAIFREQGKDIALVLTDWVMPEMGGRDLVRVLKQMAPGVHVMVMTGYVLDADERVREQVDAVMEKPLALGEFAQALKRVMG